MTPETAIFKKSIGDHSGYHVCQELSDRLFDSVVATLCEPQSAWSWQVKADKDSPNLAQLQQASRGVNQATATVVASTISGKSQIEETGSLPEAMLSLPILFSYFYVLFHDPDVPQFCFQILYCSSFSTHTYILVRWDTA